MYGQGNHGPQFQHSLQKSVPPLQQRPPGPLPPPLPPFQQGHPAPPHPLMQQGPLHVQGQVGHQPVQAIYQHAPPPPHVPVQQGPQAHRGTLNLNTGQSYLHPPPPVHGSAPLPHMYPSAKQSSQYSTHLGTQNLHHTPPPVPPPLGAPHSEILRAPPPPRMPPPPPPSQEQTLYRTSVLLAPGGVQGLQHLPPPPPRPPPPLPATSSYFSTAAYGSFLHPTPGGSHMSSMPPPPPPPLPSSPPPLPPSPPPLAPPLPSSGCFSVPTLAASDLLPISRSDKLFGSEVNVSDVSDCVYKVASSNHSSDCRTICDDYINHDGAAGSVMGPIVKDGSSNRGTVILDLLPPPPKPTKEKTTRSIETLCQLIVETGPGSEDMARQKESGKPEFEFLIGGEPGSEAAIAHEYFLWMKKKCNSESILQKGNELSESSLRPSEIESSIHVDSLKDEESSHSPADSDMEMEDDITQFDKDHGVHHSFEGSNPECVMIRNELDVKEQLTASESPPMYSLAKNASSRNVSGTGSSGLAEQAGVSKSPSDSNSLEKPLTSIAGGLSPSNASAGSAGTDSGNYSGQHSKGGSPFRLLQDYGSDDGTDNDEPCLEDVSPVKVSSPVTVGDSNLNRDPNNNMETDVGSKSPCRNVGESQPLCQPVLASSPSTPINVPDFSLESQMTVEKCVLRSVVRIKTDEQLDGRIKLTHHSASEETFQEQDDALEGGNVDVLKSGNSQKEDRKSASTQLKVDEFGRLVRKGASDSDSDDFRNMRRRGKRGRSRSRSLSPRDRRRRSPRRRRERRSRSRSWSPKNRRSRSKSPINRRVGDYGGEKMRRDKGQIPECLDFLRSRCHRGASCRFRHPESDKTGGSRRNKSKQLYQEVSPSLIPTEIQEMHTSQDIPVSGFGAQRDGNINENSKVDSRRGDLQSAISDQDAQFLVTDMEKPERVIEAAAQVYKTCEVQEGSAEQSSHLPDIDNCHHLVETHQPFLVDRVPSQIVTEAGPVKSPGDTAELVSLTNHSVHMLQNADHQTQKVDGCSTSDTSPDQTSTTFTDKLPVGEPHLNNISSTQSHPSTNSMGYLLSSDNSSFQLPPPPPLPLSQGMSTPHMPQLPIDYNIMQPTASLQYQSAPEVSNPVYQAPLPNPQPHFSVPPNSAWTSLPPPPSAAAANHLIVNEATAIPGFPPQFQQNYLPPRNDFTSHLPNHSQVGVFQHQYLSVQERYRPPLHLEDHQLKHLPVGNPLQPFAGPNLIREDFPSSSYAQGNVHTQMKLPSEQPPPYGLQHSAADNVSAHLGLPGNTLSSTSRFRPDILERNQLSCLSDLGGSRISTHYNPYASTFDQPLSSKFSSSAFRQKKDTPFSNKYDGPISLSHLPVDGLGAGSLGSRQMSSSNSARAALQVLPRSGGDQYDPLFDSIEMSPSSFGKYDRVQKWDCTNDSDIMLRLSASHKPMDVEENNKKKDAGAVAAATSLDNDEYGETADAEVGAVENGSFSSPIDMEYTAAGEIEIDQITSPGKSKKIKDSRSTKLFKIALADFVKEVLKPSWRQGNMSKEAFKTIVKKTVDKVSGAMKGHQIPKSQAKINHYIDSSQRKLTKLVMGYVDKYVKV